jgi:hypothetical protein
MSDILGRTGGPFLDQIELEKREIQSAAAENREPDFDPANLSPLSETVPGDSEPASLSQETVDELLADSSLTVNVAQIGDPSVADVTQSPEFKQVELIGETILTTENPPVTEETDTGAAPAEVLVIEGVDPNAVEEVVEPAPDMFSKDVQSADEPVDASVPVEEIAPVEEVAKPSPPKKK